MTWIHVEKWQHNTSTMVDCMATEVDKEHLKQIWGKMWTPRAMVGRNIWRQMWQQITALPYIKITGLWPMPQKSRQHVTQFRFHRCTGQALELHTNEEEGCLACLAHQFCVQRDQHWWPMCSPNDQQTGCTDCRCLSSPTDLGLCLESRAARCGAQHLDSKNHTHTHYI